MLQIATFEQQRVGLRAHAIDRRRRVTIAIANAQPDQLPYLLSADDMVSIMSWLFAYIKVRGSGCCAYKQNNM